jgi:hypothetical protein
MKSPILRCALLPLGVLAAHGAALAATTCVNSAALLQTTLTAAQTNNEADVIQLVVGTYNIGTSISINVSDNYALTIEGGYAPGCANAPTAVPDNTIVKGANGISLRLATYRGGMTLRNLTLSGFKPPAATNAIVIADNYAADVIRLENLDVSGNGVNGINDSILQIYPAGGLVLDDSIVHDNTNAFAAVHVQAQYTGLPVLIVNNTITANAGPGLSLQVYTEQRDLLANNVFWNNATSDLVIDSNVGNERPVAFNNTWLNCSGCANLSQASANNLNSDPKLTTSAPKYRLGATSPGINSGIPVPMVIPTADAAANARVVGSAPDRGAYETSTNDLGAHTYLVTSNADDAANILTLRGAITSANAAGVPASIHFHFPSCPQVISLATPLPPITVPLIIDGYSDPGAVPNSGVRSGIGSLPFNATICPILFGSVSPAPANALSVSSSVDPSVRLDVRGVRFENFQAAVALSGGVANWVHGNAFAGPFLFPNTYIGNVTGVSIDGGFADVIGGPAPADVNLIGVSSGIGGVLISGGIGTIENWYHTIANNNVGADPTGDTTTSYKNANNGIVLQNTQQHLITGNWVMANGGDGLQLDGAAYTLVQSNYFGTSAVANYGNVGMGVRIEGGASNNWVGVTDPLAMGGANAMEANGGAGVLLDLDAGVYNEVVGNGMYINGSLAIDIALLGVTADSGSENTGPNHLLHKPHLAGVVASSGGKMTVSGTIATSANAYRYLTLYSNNRCNGDAQNEIGTYVLQADASGAITFNLNVPQPNFGPAWVTATEEGYTAGSTDTSEISNSRLLKQSDDIYYDGFDCY